MDRSEIRIGYGNSSLGKTKSEEREGRREAKGGEGEEEEEDEEEKENGKEEETKRNGGGVRREGDRRRQFSRSKLTVRFQNKINFFNFTLYHLSNQ